MTAALRRHTGESPVLLTQPGPRAPTLGAGMDAGRPAITTDEHGGIVAVIHSRCQRSAPWSSRPIARGYIGVAEWFAINPIRRRRHADSAGRDQPRSSRAR